MCKFGKLARRKADAEPSSIVVRYGMVWYGTVRYAMIIFGKLFQYTVRCAAVRYGAVRYGSVQYCTVFRNAALPNKAQYFSENLALHVFFHPFLDRLCSACVYDCHSGPRILPMFLVRFECFGGLVCHFSFNTRTWYHVPDKSYCTPSTFFVSV